MNKTKYILRSILVLTIVLLVINLYRKTDQDARQIARFKMDAFNKMNRDSLSAEQKLDTLINQSSKFNNQFIEKSPAVNSGLHYLFGAIVLLIVIEVVFFIRRRQNKPPYST